MQFKPRTLKAIAEMICGSTASDSLFKYRSSSYITEFFEESDTDYRHDGSSRIWWVSDTLKEILAEPHANAQTPPASFLRVIGTLMDCADALNEGLERPGALSALNLALAREGFEAFYAPDKKCHLRHIATKTDTSLLVNPHRPFSAAELDRRAQLSTYLGSISEDTLIGDVLLPLFRQLGFHRVSAAGHKDKALEYGKDVWMRHTLPTQHVLYFGIQAKIGKLDAAGMSKAGNANILEVYNQVTMMLGHPIFDPEVGRHVLVDHAFIIAGGEITKQARNWLGTKLDAVQRSQIMFMDREDVLNLFVVTNLPLPSGARPQEAASIDDDIPF